jgi:hypothetical protein
MCNPFIARDKLIKKSSAPCRAPHPLSYTCSVRMLQVAVACDLPSAHQPPQYWMIVEVVLWPTKLCSIPAGWSSFSTPGIDRKPCSHSCAWSDRHHFLPCQRVSHLFVLEGRTPAFPQPVLSCGLIITKRRFCTLPGTPSIVGVWTRSLLRTHSWVVVVLLLIMWWVFLLFTST